MEVSSTIYHTLHLENKDVIFRPLCISVVCYNMGAIIILCRITSLQGELLYTKHIDLHMLY